MAEFLGYTAVMPKVTLVYISIFANFAQAHDCIHFASIQRQSSNKINISTLLSIKKKSDIFQNIIKKKEDGHDLPPDEEFVNLLE